MMRVIYPGSFDPLTYGHMDIIKRCANKFDQVIVAVLINNLKKGLFTIEERLHLIEENYKEYPNVKVMCFDGLLVNFCKEQNIDVLVRGIRTLQDYEYESQLAMLNKSLYPGLEVFFLSSESKYSFLSSSFIKDIASYGGDVSKFVPPNIQKALKNKYGEDL